jgi:hypothetical protein
MTTAMFAKWDADMIRDHYDTHPNATIHEVSALSGLKVQTVKMILMTQPKENNNVTNNTETLNVPAPKTRKVKAISTPATPTKAQQKAIEVQARKAEREAAKIEASREKADAKAAAIAEKAAKAAVEPATFEGYELAEGVEHSAIFSLVQSAGNALDHISAKDKLLVSDYLTFGEFQSKVAPMFKSTKVYGKFVADKLPASTTLDPALRSNCKWLFENLGEVTQTLVPGSNSIEAYKSANPTVIRRDYKAAKEAADKLAAAEEAETTVEALDAKEKADKKAADEQASKDLAHGLEAFQTWLSTSRRKDKYEQATLVLQQVIMQGGKKADIAKLLNDLGADTNPAE